MKKLLFLAAVLIVSNAFAQQEQPLSLVNVTGEGIVKIVPDKVVINARVEHTGKSATEVKAQNDQVVSRILEYLKSEGISPENFQTEYIRLNKDYNYNTKESFYSANQAISILLEDLERYEEIMSGLLSNGLNRIDGIEFQTSQKEALEAEARVEAVQNAKEKAQEYAGALDQEIGEAHMINEIETGGGPVPLYRMADMAESSQAKTIAPGEMEVRVRVQVSFFLK